MTTAKIGMNPTGHITIQKHRKGEEPHWQSDFKNIVLDAGWENLKYFLSIEKYGIAKQFYLFLGTGTTAPTPQDPGLESLSSTLGGKYNNNDAIEYGGESGGRSPTVRLKFEYAEGEAEGVWTELGLAFDEQYSRPYNRSLIKDEDGNPTSLTILSDEFLTVYVTLTMHFATLDETTTIMYNDQEIQCRIMSLDNDFFDEKHIFNSFWGVGLPMRIQYNGDSRNDIMYGSYNLSMTVQEGELKWERTGDNWPPGTERTFTGFRCGPVHGNTPKAIVEAEFTPPIVIPIDHKSSWEGVTVEFSRAEVPSE